MVVLSMLLLFFSSRRRHTRWPRDWSSDVCSSDLSAEPAPDAAGPFRRRNGPAASGAGSALRPGGMGGGGPAPSCKGAGAAGDVNRGEPGEEGQNCGGLVE